MLTALEGVATIDTTALLDPNSQGLLKALVDMIEDQGTGNASIAEAAARAIRQLASEKLHFEIMISSGILEAIVRRLSSESNTNLQDILIHILADLGFAGSEVASMKIVVETPGALPLLVQALFTPENGALQLAATRALGNLTGGELATHEIAHFPGALEQLINLLSKISMPLVQKHAARALANLAGGDEEIMLTVIKSPRALEQLVKLLSVKNNPTLHDEQYHAARTLCNLSKVMLFMEPAHTEYVKEKFNEAEGLMDGLLGLLAKGIPGSTQAKAIEALTYLDPKRANGACLHSSEAYSRREYANMILGLNKESLEDLHEADKIKTGDPPL